MQLTVYPIDIFQKVNDEDSEAFLADMQERADAGEFVNMTDDEYEVVWAQAIIDMVSARIDSIGYLDPQTISVQVVKDEDNVYVIDDSDFNRIDSLIIAYCNLFLCTGRFSAASPENSGDRRLRSFLSLSLHLG